MPGFSPLVGKNPHTLILGSMPGQQSLAQQQYYANPRNAFWGIIEAIFEIPLSKPYTERCAELIRKGIAVWDVLHDCQRPGSLDSSIERSSEQVNDFEQFFSKHTGVNKVLFNGAAAEQIFIRHCGSLIHTSPLRHYQRMPSTSPAYAAMTKQAKLKLWRNALLCRSIASA